MSAVMQVAHINPQDKHNSALNPHARKVDDPIHIVFEETLANMQFRSKPNGPPATRLMQARMYTVVDPSEPHAVELQVHSDQIPTAFAKALDARVEHG